MTKDQISDDKLILFHEVIKLLKEYNVNYWLDQGSLLGAVRNNAFLKWDHDVDMGAWYTDFNTIKKIGKKLTGMGAHVSLFRYVVKIRFSRNGISSMPVNIRFYYRKEGYAYSEFWSVMEKRNQRILRARCANSVVVCPFIPQPHLCSGAAPRSDNELSHGCFV